MMHFDPTISVGNLLTVLAIVISAFGLWHKLEIRLTRHDMILEGLVSWKNLNGISKEIFEELKKKVEDLHHRIRGIEMNRIACRENNDE